MPFIEHVIFDLDGTITDSRAGIIESYIAALNIMGYEAIPSFDFTELVGPPIRKVMQELLSHFGDDRVSEGVAAHLDHYSRVGILQNTLYDGVGSMIDSVYSRGCHIYIASAKRQRLARQVLTNLEIHDKFEGVYGSSDDGSLENKSDLIAHLLRMESIDPNTSVVVGDRCYDIVGAHLNRVRAIGAAWGYGDRHELESANADYIVSSPTQLCEFLVSSRCPWEVIHPN